MKIASDASQTSSLNRGLNRRSRAGRRRASRGGVRLAMNFTRVLLTRQWQFFALVLQLIEPVIDTLLFHQLRVGTHFAHLAMMKHDNAVRVPNRGEPMRYDEAGPIFHHLVQRILDEKLGF